MHQGYCLIFNHDRFCYMKPFEGLCDLPEQKVDAGVVTVSAKRTGYDSRENSLPFEGIATIKVEGISLHGSLAFARMLLGFLLDKKKKEFQRLYITACFLNL